MVMNRMNFKIFRIKKWTSTVTNTNAKQTKLSSKKTSNDPNNDEATVKNLNNNFTERHIHNRKKAISTKTKVKM